MSTDKIQQAAKEYADRLVHPKDSYWITANEEKIFMSSAFEAGAIWQEQQGWVRVDTPPEEGQIIDTWNGKVNRRAIFDAGKFYRHFDLADGDRVARVYYPDITHYRPLPSPPGSTPVESKEAQEHDKTLNKLYDVQERLARKEDEIGDLVLELQELRARPSKEGKYRAALEKIANATDPIYFPLIQDIATEALRP